jgi:hypothetical protein
MKLGVKFFKKNEIEGPQGEFDYARLEFTEPVAVLEVRPKALFSAALNHLAFDISNKRQEYQGKTLAVEIDFVKHDTGLKLPLLIARDDSGQIAGQRIVWVAALESEFFFNAVRKKQPDLSTVDLLMIIGTIENSLTTAVGEKNENTPTGIQ